MGKTATFRAGVELEERCPTWPASPLLFFVVNNLCLFALKVKPLIDACALGLRNRLSTNLSG